jgi:heme A synthase
MNMIALKGSGSAVVGAFCVALSYIAFFWRTLRSNRGNKLIECGALTLIVCMTMLATTIIPGFPSWAFFLLLILVVLLCFSTLFFLAQRIFRAVHARKI